MFYGKCEGVFDFRRRLECQARRASLGATVGSAEEAMDVGVPVIVLALVCALYVGMLLEWVRTRLPRPFILAVVICLVSSLVIGGAAWLKGGFNWMGDAAIIAMFASSMLVVYQYGYRLRTERRTLYLVKALAVASAIAGIAAGPVGR